MEGSILNKAIVLKLNSLWQRIGYTTVADAFVSMSPGDGYVEPALAMDITKDVNGNESLIPTKLEDWLKLPVREEDLWVTTKHGKVRAPTVIINPTYGEVEFVDPPLCFESLWKRDNGTCQYTGKKLTRAEANIDHVIPKDQGGQDTWENMVICHVPVNSFK